LAVRGGGPAEAAPEQLHLPLAQQAGLVQPADLRAQ
jgi:hypothetical protein